MKTKVRNSVKKRKSLKKATKKASKKTTKRQKKLLNYKNKNTRKNKKGGDATLPIASAAATVIAAGLAASYMRTNRKYSNRKYKYSGHSNGDTAEKKNSGHSNGDTAEKKDSFDERFDDLLSRNGLKRNKIKDNGDCLFTALLNILKNTIRSNVDENLPETVSELRKELVKWMETPESGDHGETFLNEHEEIITSEIVPGTKDKLLYDNIDHYKKAMSLSAADKRNINNYVPTSGFGGQIELIAFVKKYKDVLENYYGSTNIQLVQVVKEEPIELQISSNFVDGEITTDLQRLDTNLPILFFKDLHYDMITPKN